MELPSGPHDLREDRELARRAIAGDAEAVDVFERTFRPELVRIAGRLGVREEDLVHELMAHLLVGCPERPAKLASYRGEGSLRSWVRAVATRFVIDHLRKANARPGRAPLEEQPHSARLDRALEGRRWATYVRTATAAAFAELSARQRNLLRHATYHRLNIDELAAVYGVHRSTAARWLQRTRDTLHAAVAEKIADAASMPRAEAHSLLRAVGRDAELSLRSVLCSGFEPDVCSPE